LTLAGLLWTEISPVFLTMSMQGWRVAVLCAMPRNPKGINVPEISDDELLTSATQGDIEAFGQLYERYVGRIYNYVYYRTGNTYDAEDLTERVFMRALHHIGNYNNRGLPFSAWLYRIAHNLVANWHRDNSRRKEVPLDDGLLTGRHAGHPEYELLQTEEQENLIRVVRCLPEERQQLLILKFVDHLSNSEIGVVMGRTEGAVKSLYHRTLLTIRDELGAVLPELENLNLEGE
jgi:RNA polymerase sigma-70 factor, ECF subfamily